MKISVRQLRRLIREEIIREGMEAPDHRQMVPLMQNMIKAIEHVNAVNDILLKLPSLKPIAKAVLQAEMFLNASVTELYNLQDSEKDKQPAKSATKTQPQQYAQ